MFSLARIGIPFAVGAVASSKASSPSTSSGGINYLFWGVVAIAGLIGVRLLAQTVTAIKKAF